MANWVLTVNRRGIPYFGDKYESKKVVVMMDIGLNAGNYILERQGVELSPKGRDC